MAAGRDAVASLARRQHGNVTRAQLHGLGLSDVAIKRRVTAGWLHRVHRGVYAVGRPAVTPLERASAAVLACGRGAALSHLAAAKLWGFVKHWPRVFDVTVPGDRRPTGIRTHRSPGLTHRNRRPQRGIWVTSPARTILDCAPLVPAHELTRLVNDALLSTHPTAEALAETLARFPTHPGAKLLRPFVDELGGPTRSEFEDYFKAFCRRYGLPQPITNTRVGGHEVDALFAAERLIVELDSWEFHSGREAFETDRNRDADTLAARHATVRITWERLLGTPAAEADRLHAILAMLRDDAA